VDETLQVEVMVEKCDNDEFVLFVGIAKKIWLRRNTVVDSGEFLHPNSMTTGAILFAEEYKKANLTESVFLAETRSGIDKRRKHLPKDSIR
jgi:hypothetical protein